MDRDLEKGCNMMLLIFALEQLSWLKIFIYKSEIFCFGAAVQATFQYTKLFDCDSGDFPMRNLGIPIHYRKLLNCNTPGHDPWNATNGTTLSLEYIRDISILSRL